MKVPYHLNCFIQRGEIRRFPLVMQQFRIQHCHCWGKGLTPGRRTSTHHRCGQKKKKKKSKNKKKREETVPSAKYTVTKIVQQPIQKRGRRGKTPDLIKGLTPLCATSNLPLQKKLFEIQFNKN